jgi:protein-disulfide isomerase
MDMDKTGGVSQPTPSASGRKGIWWAMLILSLVGLLISVVLARIHFKVNTEAGFHSFCGRGNTFNCDDVARSPYSVLLGVPTALWGIFGYALAAAVAYAGLRARRAALIGACGLLLFTGFAVLSAVLGALSAFRLHALCLLCAATYGINLLLFVLALVQAGAMGFSDVTAAPSRFLLEGPGKTLAILGLLGAIALGLVALVPPYWRHGTSPIRKPFVLEGLARGEVPGGGHWIGAREPTLTVTEFSDYECPYCRQAHAQLRNIVAMFPDRVRLVHRHFPLDQACNRSIDHAFHQTACRAAIIAECAGRAGRFWEANDALFEPSNSFDTLSTKEIAADLKLDPAALDGCMKGEGLVAVKNDIEVGIALKLEGTPTFLVDGQLYFGNLPAAVLERLRAAPDASK